MKMLRGLLVVMLGSCAVLALLAAFQPARSASASRTAAVLDVVINEVAWSGTISNTNAEWIELKNNTTSTIDLNGWRLSSSDGSPNLILTGTLAANGYYLLERTSDATVSDVPADQIYTGALVDGGERLHVDRSAQQRDRYGQRRWRGMAGRHWLTQSLFDGADRSLASDTDLNWASNDGITRNGVDVGGNPINGTPRQLNSAKPYIPTAPGSVLISAVHADGYVTGQADEGFRLTNVSTQTITLTNWIVTDGQGEGTLNLTGTLAPDQSIWLARYAITFTQQFGFKPDLRIWRRHRSDCAQSQRQRSSIWSPRTMNWRCAKAANNWIDAVVWGTGQITDTAWISGWIGSNVQRYSDGDVSATGQILYRKLDEATGKIVTDTNTALDWANDRTDPISGRKTQYPGWDLEKFWQTAKVTGTATLTVAIAPDNAYRVISDVLGSAQSVDQDGDAHLRQSGFARRGDADDRARGQRDDLAGRRAGGRHRRSGNVGVPADRSGGRAVLVHDQRFERRTFSIAMITCTPK